jgi:tryptophan-rich sensory protein
MVTTPPFPIDPSEARAVVADSASVAVIVSETVFVGEPEAVPEAPALDASPPLARPRSSLPALAVLAGASVLVAALGARVARRNKVWYRLLRTSKITPPDRVFRSVWPLLYTLGALSAWRVARRPPSRARTRALALWGAQLACNAAWPPLFFAAHVPGAALVDIGAHAGTLGAYALAARQVDRTAARMVVPHLGWLAFAAFLNTAVLLKNRGMRARLLFR